MVSDIKQIKDGKYNIYNKEMIGKGSFACVYIGENNHTKERVAVKVIPNSKIDSTRAKEALKREFEILKQFRHPNIVSFLDFVKSYNNNYMIFEFCEGGDL
jgi:serine/threonine-protein kinase ULK/ATG1